MGPRDIRVPVERAYLGRQRPNGSEIEAKTLTLSGALDLDFEI